MPTTRLRKYSVATIMLLLISMVGNCGRDFVDIGPSPMEIKSSDKTPPAKIEDLKIKTATAETLTISWTAPGDDSTNGTATKYYISYVNSNETDSIALDNFYQLTLVENPPIPKAAGTPEEFELANLTEDTYYCVAIISEDDAGNKSPLSDVACGKTVDTSPPDLGEASDGGTADGGGGGNIFFDVATVPEGKRLKLTWNIPENIADLRGLMILQRQGKAIESSPVNNSQYTLGDRMLDGSKVIFTATKTDSQEMPTEYTDENLVDGEHYYYALFVFDDDYLYSFPLTADGIPVDTTPPAQAGNLQIDSTVPGRVALSWTLSDDEDGKNNLSVIVARANDTATPPERATLDNVSVASELDTNFSVIAVEDAVESYVDRDTEEGKTYTYAIYVLDKSDNASQPTSQTITTAVTLDVTSPGQISDLTAMVISDTEITILWTEPADDGFLASSGVVAYYDIRYRQTLPGEEDMTSADFDDLAVDSEDNTKTHKIEEPPAPVLPGEMATHSITGLLPQSRYCFAIQSYDDASNPSSISNIACMSTIDEIPPASPQMKVADVGGPDISAGHKLGVELTPPSDSDLAGTLVLMKSGSDFTSMDIPPNGKTHAEGEIIGSAEIVWRLTTGEASSRLVSNLKNNETYYFAAVSYDYLNQYSTPTYGNGVPHDIIAPESPHDLEITNKQSNSGELSLVWQLTTDSADPSGIKTLILRADSENDLSTAPVSGTAYQVGNKIGNATVAYSGGATILNESGLTLKKTYYYGLYAYDPSYNYSSMLKGNGKPTAADQTSPTFSSLTTSPTQAKNDSAVAITFASSEALAQNPTVTVDGNSATFVSVTNSTSYAYTYQAKGTEREGTVEIKITGKDRYDNEGSYTGSMIFDFTAPTISNQLSTPTLAGVSDRINITFTAADANGLAGVPTVTAGAETAIFAGKNADNYTYYYTPPSDKNEITVQFAIAAVDNASNGGKANVSISYDTKAPSTPSNLSLTMNEPGINDRLSGDCDPETTAIITANNSSFTDAIVHTITSCPFSGLPVGDNVQTVYVAAKDKAGNRSAVSSITNDIDGPIISNIEISPQYAKNDTEVYIKFNVSEEVPGSNDPEVRLCYFNTQCTDSPDDDTYECPDAHDAWLWYGSPMRRNFTYKYTITEGYDDESDDCIYAAFQIDAIDKYGNPGTGLEFITIDYTKPQTPLLVSAEANMNHQNSRTEVLLQWIPTGSEPIEGFEVLYGSTEGGPYSGTYVANGISPLDVGKALYMRLLGIEPLVTTMYFAVRSLDFAGNTSDTSNEFAIKMAEDYPSEYLRTTQAVKSVYNDSRGTLFTLVDNRGTLGTVNVFNINNLEDMSENYRPAQILKSKIWQGFNLPPNGAVKLDSVSGDIYLRGEDNRIYRFSQNKGYDADFVGKIEPNYYYDSGMYIIDFAVNNNTLILFLQDTIQSKYFISKVDCSETGRESFEARSSEIGNSSLSPVAFDFDGTNIYGIVREIVSSSPPPATFTFKSFTLPLSSLGTSVTLSPVTFSDLPLPAAEIYPNESYLFAQDPANPSDTTKYFFFTYYDGILAETKHKIYTSTDFTAWTAADTGGVINVNNPHNFGKGYFLYTENSTGFLNALKIPDDASPVESVFVSSNFRSNSYFIVKHAVTDSGATEGVFGFSTDLSIYGTNYIPSGYIIRKFRDESGTFDIPNDYSLVPNMPNAVTSIAGNDNLLYDLIAPPKADGGPNGILRLNVWDTSAPEHPQLLGRLDLTKANTGLGNDIQDSYFIGQYDQYIYFVDLNVLTTLYRIDISTPSVPSFDTGFSVTLFPCGTKWYTRGNAYFAQNKLFRIGTNASSLNIDVIDLDTESLTTLSKNGVVNAGDVYAEYTPAISDTYLTVRPDISMNQNIIQLVDWLDPASSAFLGTPLILRQIRQTVAGEAATATTEHVLGSGAGITFANGDYSTENAVPARGNNFAGMSGSSLGSYSLRPRHVIARIDDNTTITNGESQAVFVPGDNPPILESSLNNLFGFATITSDTMWLPTGPFSWSAYQLADANGYQLDKVINPKNLYSGFNLRMDGNLAVFLTPIDISDYRSNNIHARQLYLSSGNSPLCEGTFAVNADFNPSLDKLMVTMLPNAIPSTDDEIVNLVFDLSILPVINPPTYYYDGTVTAGKPFIKELVTDVNEGSKSIRAGARPGASESTYVNANPGIRDVYLRNNTFQPQCFDGGGSPNVDWRASSAKHDVAGQFITYGVSLSNGYFQMGIAESLDSDMPVPGEYAVGCTNPSGRLDKDLALCGGGLSPQDTDYNSLVVKQGASPNYIYTKIGTKVGGTSNNTLVVTEAQPVMVLYQTCIAATNYSLMEGTMAGFPNTGDANAYKYFYVSAQNVATKDYGILPVYYDTGANTLNMLAFEGGAGFTESPFVSLVSYYNTSSYLLGFSSGSTTSDAIITCMNLNPGDHTTEGLCATQDSDLTVSVDTWGYPVKLLTRGNYLIAVYQYGIRVLDISALPTVTVVATYFFNFDARDTSRAMFELDHSFTHLVDNRGDYYIYQRGIDFCQHPIRKLNLTSSFYKPGAPDNDYPVAMKIYGSKSVIAVYSPLNAEYKVALFEANGDNFTMLDSETLSDAPASSPKVVISGPYIYYVQSDTSIKVLKVDLDNGILVAPTNNAVTIGSSGTPTALYADNRNLYIATDYPSLEVYNLRTYDETIPGAVAVLTNSYSLPSFRDITQLLTNDGGKYLFLLDRDTEFLVYDKSMPNSLKFLFPASTSGRSVTSVTGTPTALFMTLYNNTGIYKLDISK